MLVRKLMIKGKQDNFIKNSKATSSKTSDTSYKTLIINFFILTIKKFILGITWFSDYILRLPLPLKKHRNYGIFVCQKITS